jgi:NAD(P)-dependent dehydrogenase (short-subunit alcohol dehydrogenase family)
MIRTSQGVKIEGAVALVTGGNRGLGKAFVRALLDAGAAKVYAAARDASSVTESGATPVELDIRNDHDITAAANACRDVTLPVNNAGVAKFTPPIGAPSMDAARDEIAVNHLGTLAMCRAFAPILAATSSARHTRHWRLRRVYRHRHDGESGSRKNDARAIASETLAALERGETEILADDRSREMNTTQRLWMEKCSRFGMTTSPASRSSPAQIKLLTPFNDGTRHENVWIQMVQNHRRGRISGRRCCRLSHLMAPTRSRS